MRALLAGCIAVAAMGATCGGYAAAQAAPSPTPAPDIVALAPVPQGRLTDAARPVAYRIDLTVDPAQPRFSGRVEIDVQLKQAARFVDLHGRGLAMRHVEARVRGQAVPGTWTQVDDSGVARLTFPRPLPAGPITLAFDYDAAFGEGPSGLFRAKVGDDWDVWSQLQSIDARAVFPSFDEPGFKLPFTVTLRTPPGLMAVSNAPVARRAAERGLDAHRFAPTAPLPTYLVAVMIGPFAKLEGAVAPTPERAVPLPLRIISPRPNGDRLAFALDGSKAIVGHLESYFGEAFPFSKLDQITSPVQSGAMENAGAALYNDALIVMANDAAVPQKRNFGMVVAHELAHQWFGDLVTPAWWDDIWLNESFANWLGYRIGNAWRPDLNIGTGAAVEGFAAMQTDALLAGRAIRQPIERSVQIDAAFDMITYGKGGHVVAMIAAYMGDEKFRSGVRRYMAAHRHGNATSTDFFRAMAEAAQDARILPAMRSFTDQQGVPLVTFQPAGSGQYAVTQSRYARLGTVPPLTQWGVPLCARQGAVRSCTLLDTPQGQIVLKGGAGPLMPNSGGTGYYRFELPQAEWDALIAAADTLPGGEAVAVADSLRASFEAGRASPAQLAALARKLALNPDSYASAVALAGLEGINAAGFFDAPALASYRRFVHGLYAPRLAASGFDLKAGVYAQEAPEISQQRVQLVWTLATIARDAAVRTALKGAADAYLGGNTRALDNAYLDLALKMWSADAGPDGTKKLFERALSSQDPVFRPSALDAVGASGNADTARWVLSDARDPRLRPTERNAMINAVIRTEQTRELGWEWMKGNLPELLDGAGGIFFTTRLPRMVSGFCSVARADEIAGFLRPRLAGKPSELDLERTIERVRSCGMLKDARAAEASQAVAALP
ncbi:MAG: M1 family metallopeptidase [Pseudomonadota bacterium]